MKRIVVGYDDSAGSLRAARWAAEVAERTGGELVLVGTSPPDPAEHARLDRAMQATRTRLADHRAGTTAAPIATAMIDSPGGDPREVLAGVDHTHGADMVVVGRQGTSSGPGLLHLGSVAEYLAHHTTIPLVIVPEDATLPLDRIVVGVDGSPASRAAARWCAELARATGAGVTAVTVHEPFLEWTPEADPEGWRRETERRILDEFAPELAEPGIDVTAVAVRGQRPADGLLAASTAADLVVIGVTPTGRHVRLRAGGVAFAALHGARGAVALVPAPSA